MQIFITFFLLPYIHLIGCEWVELPHIPPPRSTGGRDLTTEKSVQTNIMRRVHDESSYEEYFPISSSRSYEDSRSLGDYKPRPWNTKRSSSPFSGGGDSSFDSSSYYRWRNTSITKVHGSPNIVESIDYSIVSPESTPLKDDEGLGFPKNIIISSKTPMISGPEILVKQGMKRKQVIVDSKLDEESMSVTDGNKKYSHEETETVENDKVYEESNEVPVPDFDKDGVVENDEEYEEEELDSDYEEQMDKYQLSNDLAVTSEQTKSAQVSAPSWKNFSFSGFLRYLKQIQDKFLLKTSRTVEDKVLMLESLQQRIADQIITRIHSLFHKRTKRSFWSEKEEEYETEKHKDGIDFPSAEGALLSIAFLTFAVFLIKLVLQVIAAIKYKYAYYGSGPGGAALVANVIKTNRNARRLSMTNEEIHRTAQIMNAVKENK